MKKAEWILFDFGGCLDSDGIHSRTLFYNHFLELGLLKADLDLSHFQDAYTYSDRTVIDQSLIMEANLLEMNQAMCNLIAHKLDISANKEIARAALAITEDQSFYLRRNKAILEKLQQNYKLGIISNFSGNLTKILEEFSLLPYFDFVLDSYHVGFCKPSLEIFKLAISKCETSAANICFVGDNIINDITPAKSLGIKTVLITSKDVDNTADYTISELGDLLKF